MKPRQSEPDLDSERIACSLRKGSTDQPTTLAVRPKISCPDENRFGQMHFVKTSPDCDSRPGRRDRRDGKVTGTTRRQLWFTWLALNLRNRVPDFDNQTNCPIVILISRLSGSYQRLISAQMIAVTDHHDRKLTSLQASSVEFEDFNLE